MTIDFSPAASRSDAVRGDLRIAACSYEKNSRSKNPRLKCIAIDFRLAPLPAAHCALSHGDKVLVSWDEDGSFTVTKCGDGANGFTVRCGTVKNKRRKNRRASLYWRVSATKAQAEQILGDAKALSYRLSATDGKTSIFTAAEEEQRRIRFVPARQATHRDGNHEWVPITPK